MASPGTLAELVVKIAADLRPFLAEIKGAKGVVERQTSKMARAFKKVKSAVDRAGKAMKALKGAAAALAAAGGLTAAVVVAVDYTDAMAKAARRVNITTDELQRLRFAADVAGADMQILDRAVERLSRNLGDLKTRTSSMVSTALQEFDPALLKQLKGVTDVAKGFRIAADAIAGYKSATVQGTVAAALFGRAGLRMINLLKLGSIEIDKQGNLLNEFGGIMDRELILQAEIAKDQITLMATAFKTQLSTALVAMTPILDTVVVYFKKMSLWMGDVISSFRAMDDLSLNQLRREIQQTKQDLADANMDAMIGEKTSPKLAAIGDQRARKHREKLAKLDKALADRLARDELEAARRAAEDAAAQKANFDVAEENRLEKLAEDRIRFDNKMRGLIMTANENEIGLAEEKRDRLLEEAALLYEGSVEEFEKRAADIEDVFDASVAKINEVGATAFEELGEELRTEVISEFATLVSTGEASFEQLLQSFKTKFIEQAILEIASKLGGALKTFGAGQGGYTGSFIGGIGAIFAGGGAHGIATGAGKTYKVGERGPEYFTPGVKGVVSPMGGGGGNQVVNIEVINNSGEQVNTEQQEMGSGFDQRQMIRVVIGEVAADMARQNSPVGSAMARSFHVQRRGTAR